MKLLKLSILCNKEYKKENYSLFKLKTLKPKENKIIGNILRRNLLKETV
jgi:hypothetical protein